MATSPKPQTVDEYLAALPDDRWATVEQLRRVVRAAAPGATETIAYDMPALRLDGRFLVSYAAYRSHYSLFPASQRVIDELGDAVRPYVSGRGTFRFPKDKPIPLDLVEGVVRIRLVEVGAKEKPTG